jgi:hypothetical protein
VTSTIDLTVRLRLRTRGSGQPLPVIQQHSVEHESWNGSAADILRSPRHLGDFEDRLIVGETPPYTGPIVEGREHGVWGWDPTRCSVNNETPFRREGLHGDGADVLRCCGARPATVDVVSAASRPLHRRQTAIVHHVPIESGHHDLGMTTMVCQRCC